MLLLIGFFLTLFSSYPIDDKADEAFLNFFLPNFFTQSPSKHLIGVINIDELDKESRSSKTVEGEFSSKINGLVNPVTGRCTITEEDYLMPGPIPFMIDRTHHELGNMKVGTAGWSILMYSIGYICFEDEITPLRIYEKQGELLSYATKNRNITVFKHPLKVSKDCYPKGVVNCSSGTISAASNKKNYQLNIPNKREIILTESDGTKRIYYPYMPGGYIWTTTALQPILLKEIIFPSGHKMHFRRYLNSEKEAIIDFEITNPQSTKVFSSLKLITSPEKSKSRWLKIEAADGRKISYNQKTNKDDFYSIDNVEGLEKGKVHYEYNNDPFRLYKKTFANGFWFSNESSHSKSIPGQIKPNPAKKGYSATGSASNVAFQRAPVGPNDETIITNSFFYYRKDKGGDAEGYTEVFDALKNKTIYYHNKHKRVVTIEKYIGNNQLIQSEHMVWEDDKKHNNYSNLLARYYKDEKGDICSLKTFSYDLKGNVIEERLYGDFSGKCKNKIFYDEKTGFKVDGVEYCVKYNQYCDNDFNYKLSDVASNGVVTQYKYLEGTNLPIQELVYDHGSIKERCFLKYDEDNLLIEKIVDDGSTDSFNDLKGVSERRILRYERKQEGVGIGLPYIVEEKYLDLKTKQEVLLNRKERIYHKNGQIAQEAHFDGNNQYLYTLYFTYDDLGRLIEEVNGKGIKSTYRYNECSWLTYESSREGVEKYFEYDIAGRLKTLKEVHDQSKEYVTKNTYNALSQKVSQEDSYGSTEYYEWDPFGRLLKVISSEIMNEEGVLVRPTIEKKYDAFGRVIEEVDPKGFKTCITYNVEDKPTVIFYPDGAKESFEYSTTGNLIRSKSKTGAVTEYEYDYRDREVVKSVYDENEILLYRTFKVYKGWRLISETDPQGLVTTYEYDGAGRVIVKKVQESLTLFEYDALGQVYKQTQQIEDGDFINHLFIRNKFGEVIEEQVLSKKGVKKKLEYAYDLYGNKIQITNFTDKPCKTHIAYNYFNEPTKIIDPLGFVTTFEYSRVLCPDTSRLVKEVKEIDPLGQITITLSDSVGRPVSSKVISAQGKTLGFTKRFFDISSNLALNREDVFVNGEKIKSIETKRIFGPLNRIEEIIEAYRSNEEHTTKLIYNDQGLQSIKVNPDGSCLYFEYNCIGLLVRKFSSLSDDIEPIDYSYIYNKVGLPTFIKNNLTNKATYRNYTKEGRLLSETLETGYKIRYAYDQIGRRSKITLPDASSIFYDYDGPQVYSITRYSSLNNTLYKYLYDSRDLSGRPTKTICEQVIQNYTWNPLGRLCRIDTGHFIEQVEEFDPVGNILKVSCNDKNALFEYDDLYQVSLENGSFSHTYCFDSLNNKVHQDGDSIICNDLNQIVSDSIENFYYDKRGNLKQKGDARYHFDALDRLVKVIDSSGNVYQYFYDGFDRRISKQTKLLTENFLYLDKEEVGLIDNENVIKQLRILSDTTIDKSATIAIELENNTYIPTSDFRGSLRALVDLKTNTVKESYDISAFGIPRFFDTHGQEIEDSLVDIPWIFSFRRQDKETGFIFFGRRFYNPQQGSWITKDPSGFDDGYNRYAFVGNNPIVNTDLWGLTTLKGANALNKSNVVNDNKDSAKPSLTQTIVNEIRSHAGNIVKRIGHEMPIPYIRLGVISLGHFIERGSFIPPEGEELQESSKTAVVGTRQDKNYIVSFVNGIGNTYDEAYKTVNDISSVNSDIMIHLIHNSSHGVILDVLECMANSLGIPTHSLEVVQSEFHRLSQYAQETDRRVLHIAHSQGGLLTKGGLKALSPYERSYFDVISYGSACILPQDLAASVYNYVNLFDPVPWIADWPGMIRALCFSGSHLQIIDHPRKAKLFDHMILGDSYTNHWKKNTNKLLGT